MMKIRPIIIITLIISGCAAFFIGGHLLYTTFFSVLIMVTIAFVYIIVIQNILTVTVEKYSEVCYTGDTVTHSIAFDSPIPVINMHISKISHNEILHEMNGEITLAEYFQFKHTINYIQRGIYETGHFRITIQDFFSFIEVTFEVNTLSTLKVYPSLYPVFDTRFTGKDIFIEKQTSEVLREDSYESSHNVLYKKGDPIKKINWKVSAKFNELYVRKNENISGYGITLLINPPHILPGTKDEKINEELLYDIACSFAYNAVMSDKAVSIYFISESGTHIEITTIADFITFHEFTLGFYETSLENSSEQIIDFCRTYRGTNDLYVITVDEDRNLTQFIDINENHHLYQIVINEKQENLSYKLLATEQVIDLNNRFRNAV
jgi:uncharacterized protein (DUF58 family)